MHLMVNSEVKMFKGDYLITQISHSNPETHVSIYADGDLIHLGKYATILQLADGKLFKGLHVHEWFKVDAPDAHVIIYTQSKEDDDDNKV